MLNIDHMDALSMLEDAYDLMIQVQDTLRDAGVAEPSGFDDWITHYEGCQQ